MKLRKMLKWAMLAAGVGYARGIRSLEPTPRDLMNPEWHREAPVRLLFRACAKILPAFYERYGEEGVRALQFVFYQIGSDRANLMRKALDIDVNDARSLGRVIDYEDTLLGVRGVWTEEFRGRAVKEERHCPAASELSQCPEVCSSLITAMEAGTFSHLNPGLKAPAAKGLLSKGDDYCLKVLELEAPARGKGISPQATPGEFPPVIKVPGLIWRLAVMGLASVLAALIKLAVSGTDQPMQWYESFRFTDLGKTSLT